MDVVQLREGGDYGGEVQTSKQPSTGQVVQAQQATHHRLGDPGHLEAVQQGGGDDPGTTWDVITVLPWLVQQYSAQRFKVALGATCFKEEVRIKSGKFTEQGKAGSPKHVPTFLLASPLHNC